jgi:hypothetical protein
MTGGVKVIAVFSLDGRFILGGEGCPFFTARLWHARSTEVLLVFAGAHRACRFCRLNASGTQVLTSSDRVRLVGHRREVGRRTQADQSPAFLRIKRTKMNEGTRPS